jgi:hypothetical protein
VGKGKICLTDAPLASFRLLCFAYFRVRPLQSRVPVGEGKIGLTDAPLPSFQLLCSAYFRVRPLHHNNEIAE